MVLYHKRKGNFRRDGESLRVRLVPGLEAAVLGQENLTRLVFKVIIDEWSFWRTAVIDCRCTKMLGLAFVSACFFIACAGNKPVLEHSPQEYPLSHGRYATEVGQDFKSPFSGKVIVPVSGPEPFDRVVGIETEKTYYRKGHKYTCSYEVLYTNVELTKEIDSKLEENQVLGTATQDSVYVVLRSKIFDPYLVSMAQVVPYRYHDYWYFYPGMLDNSTMDWLSYAPFNRFQAEWNYRKISRMAQDEVVENKILVYTVLSEYPALAPDGTSSQTIIQDGRTINLQWHKDYNYFLEAEYRLGDSIYLYLTIEDIEDKVYECSVDEYSLVSPDEIVDGYISDIQSKM